MLEKLGKDFDVSLDGLICAKGPMLFKEKEKGETRGKEVLPAEEGTQQERSRGPELRELLDHMEKVPLLYHEIMVYFYKFKMTNNELIEAALGEQAQ